MKNRILIILTILILNTQVFCSHSIAHSWFGKHIFYGLDQPLKDTGLKDFSPLIKPVALMAGHVLQDKFISEAGLGQYTLEINIVRVVIGYFLTPDDKKEDFLYYTFWSNLPDLIDKGFNVNYFHNKEMTPLISLTRDQNELIDELILASMAIEF